MSLRRFPWKAPRLTDNSYKLFVSPPTAGTPPAEAVARRTSEGKSKSTLEMTPATEEPRRESASAPSTEASDANSEHHSHHHHHHRQKSGEQEADARSVQSQQQIAPKQEVLKGPWRLLRLLPRESRNIIGHMLEINPKRRATLEDMMADPWVASALICTQGDNGQIMRTPGHEHTLEPGNAAQPATA